MQATLMKAKPKGGSNIKAIISMEELEKLKYATPCGEYCTEDISCLECMCKNVGIKLEIVTE